MINAHAALFNQDQQSIPAFTGTGCIWCDNVNKKCDHRYDKSSALMVASSCFVSVDQLLLVCSLPRAFKADLVEIDNYLSLNEALTGEKLLSSQSAHGSFWPPSTSHAVCFFLAGTEKQEQLFIPTLSDM